METPDFTSRFLEPSSETMDSANPAETLYHELTADCKRLRDMAEAFYKAEGAFLSERKRMIGNGITDASAFDALLALQRDYIIAERAITDLKVSITKRVDDFNCGKIPQERINLVYTADGFPVRAKTQIVFKSSASDFRREKGV